MRKGFPIREGSTEQAASPISLMFSFQYLSCSGGVMPSASRDLSLQCWWPCNEAVKCLSQQIRTLVRSHGESG